MPEKLPSVSIIIPVKTKNDYLMECIKVCNNLDYPDFEIIVFPDEKESIRGARVIPTGNVTAPVKRDLAIKHASGEILAFIDDDAYPRSDWLRNAIVHFKDRQVGAVGGPAVTPESDSIRQKASGNVFSSLIGGGSTRNRYVPSSGISTTDDWPTVNFLVRKDIFKKLGGFDSEYWPGEDTKYCLDLIESNHKIIQDPNVLVYHHRRRVFKPHLVQVKRYAQHRGYFVKKFPQTSFKPGYFFPSLLVVYMFGGFLVSNIYPILLIPYAFVLYLYFFLVLLSSISKSIKLLILTSLAIILTHVTYGVYFIKGLLTRSMKI
jgi:cellulose synthase/poly-beta-1,6-N-acetylglucosamine synthase-like glycosyltransferase